MTVIVWDGKTLAADKLGDAGGHRLSVTKVRRHGDVLAGGAGDADYVSAMHAWVDSGAKPEEFPEHQGDDDKCANFMTVDRQGVIRLYGRTPHPIKIDPGCTYAIGSGRDYALTALHFGKTAREAVEVAIALNSTCGIGVDELTLEAQ